MKIPEFDTEQEPEIYELLSWDLPGIHRHHRIVRKWGRNDSSNREASPSSLEVQN